MAKKPDRNDPKRRPEEDLDDFEDVIDFEDVEIEEVIEVTDDIVEVDEVDEVVEVEDIVEVDDADETKPTPPPSSPKKTQMAGQRASHTMLASEDEVLEVDDVDVVESEESTPPPVPPSPPKKTQMPSRGGMHTQLAPEDQDPLEVAKEAESAQKGGSGSFPNLSLDDHEEPEATEVEEIEEIEEVNDVDDSALIDDVTSDDTFDEEVLVDGASEFNLEPPRTGEQPSGLDIIAEEIESKTGIAGPQDTGEEEAVGHEVAHGPESSAVDFGSDMGPGSVEIDFGEDDVFETVDEKDQAALDAEATAAYEAVEDGVEVDDVVIEDIDESLADAEAEVDPDALVDIEEVADEDDTFLHAAQAEQDVDEVDDSLLVEPDEEPATVPKGVDDLDDDDDVPRRGKGKKKKKGKQRKPNYATRWLGGIVLGLVLAVGGVGATRYFAPAVLHDSIKQIPTSDPRNDPTVVKKPPAPKPDPMKEARNLLVEGAYTKAISRILGTPPKAADKRTPDEHYIVGAAKWGQYSQLDPAKQAEPQAQTLLQEALKSLEKASTTAAANTPAKRSSTQLLALINDVVEQPKEWAKKQGELQGKIATLNTEVAKAQGDAKAAQDLAKKKAEDLTKVQTMAKDLQTKLNTESKKLEAIGKALGKALMVPPEKLAKEGPTKIAALEKVKTDLKTKLDAINAELKKAVAKEGAEGIKLLAEKRAKLKGDIAKLKSAVVDTLAKLNKGKAPDAKDLEKLAMRLKAEATALAEKARSPVIGAVGSLLSSGSMFAGRGADWFRTNVNVAKLQSQLAYYKAKAKFQEATGADLKTLTKLVREPDKADKTDRQKAKKYADFLIEHAKKDPDVLARAFYLKGLVGRAEATNKLQFDEAKDHLTKAVQLAKGLPKRPEWFGEAETLLGQMNNPAPYYLTKIARLRKTGDLSAALGVADEGLSFAPGDPRLLLVRGELRLAALANAKKMPQPAVAKIRKDAEAATKDPATKAKALHVLGKLAEKEGDLKTAISNFREALKVETNKERQRAYEADLIEAILRKGRESADTSVRPPQVSVRTPLPAIDLREQLASMMALVVVGVVPGQDGPDDMSQSEKDLREVIALAKAMVAKSKSPTIQGRAYMAWGEAISRLGQRTEGLKKFVKGLRMVYPDESTERLQKLIADHPAFEVPDALTRVNPALAEKYFAKGVLAYRAGNYKRAEGYFKQSLAYNKKYATYHYFLGLAQLAQKSERKSRSATAHFEEGTKYELLEQPTKDDINFALEPSIAADRLILERARERSYLREENENAGGKKPPQIDPGNFGFN